LGSQLKLARIFIEVTDVKSEARFAIFMDAIEEAERLSGEDFTVWKRRLASNELKNARKWSLTNEESENTHDCIPIFFEEIQDEFRQR
jgi:hypothetical protein